MQRGVREEDVKFTEVEQALSGLVRSETLVLGIDDVVSLRWCDTFYQCLSAWHVIVTCGPSVTWCLCACTYVS